MGKIGCSSSTPAPAPLLLTVLLLPSYSCSPPASAPVPPLLLLLLPSCSQCSAPSCWVKGGVQRQRSLSFTIFFWQILRANSSSHFPLHLHIHTLLVLKLGATACYYYLQLSFTIFFRLLLQVISLCAYLQRRTYPISKLVQMLLNRLHNMVIIQLPAAIVTLLV